MNENKQGKYILQVGRINNHASRKATLRHSSALNQMANVSMLTLRF